MGWTEAKVNPMVAAEVSGQIERIFFDTGQVVKAGQTLLSINKEQQELEKKELQSEVDRFS